MSDTDKRFQALFDIRHDNQLVDQRVRWLSGDDRWLGHADKAPLFITLLGMTHGGTFHWRFHRAWATAGADIQLTQTELGTHPTGVQVFGFVNGVTAPADDHIRCFANVQGTGVTQNRKHQVGDMNRAFQVKMLEAARVVDLPVNKQDVTQHGKQVGLQGTNNPPVDEGLFRRVDHFKFHAALAAQHVDIKAFEAG